MDGHDVGGVHLLADGPLRLVSKRLGFERPQPAGRRGARRSGGKSRLDIAIAYRSHFEALPRDKAGWRRRRLNPIESPARINHADPLLLAPSEDC